MRTLSLAIDNRTTAFGLVFSLIGWLVLTPPITSADPLDLGELLPKPGGAEVRIDWIHEPDERIRPLSLLEQRQVKSQLEKVDAAANRHLGQSLSGDLSDLEILQRLVDEKVFDPEKDRQELQALGVVLGDLLVKKHGYKWIAHTDREGRTRALINPANDQVIFPVTAISRRVEVGLAVDVRDLYEKLVPRYPIGTAPRRSKAITGSL